MKLKISGFSCKISVLRYGEIAYVSCIFTHHADMSDFSCLLMHYSNS